MSRKVKFAIPAVFFLFFSLYLSMFTVREIDTVFVLEFGKIIKKIDKAGLYFRVPFLHEVNVLDKRINQVDAPAMEVICLDQKRLIVDAYAKYKISNSQLFFQSLRNHEMARTRINTILNSAMRRAIASYPLSSLLTEDRAEIMNKVKADAFSQSDPLGIDIVDVRIIRADLPVGNSEAVFSRMRTDREIEAKQLRAKGSEDAQTIRSKADREVREIIAKANMDAQITKGKADGKASVIYANAFSRDPEFFRFYKTMNAYKGSLRPDNTKFIVGYGNEFLSDMKKDSKGN